MKMWVGCGKLRSGHRRLEVEQPWCKQQIAEPYPIKRLATTEEMARAVMFLASDEATVIVGTDVDVTGGYLTK